MNSLIDKFLERYPDKREDKALYIEREKKNLITQQEMNLADLRK